MQSVDMNIKTGAAEILEYIPRGAFLTVKHGNRLNTMTIGWGTVGVIWTRDVFVAAVRNSRHTYTFLERAADFTVSIPTSTAKKSQLAYCGTHSGREGDKFAACGLEALPGRLVQSPVVSLQGIHIECKIVLRSAMDPLRMAPELTEVYPAKDYHTFYFGEVLACYRQTD